MKRFLSVLISALLALTALCVPAGAEDQPLSLRYTPRTQRGTLYYLDIVSETEIAAAVFELVCEPAADYHSVSSDDDHAAVSADVKGSTVKIAYSNRSSGSGKLLRVAFKAQSADAVRFTLRTVQAVDEQLRYLTDIPDAVLEVEPDAEDAAHSGSGLQSKSSNVENNRKKSYGSSGSEKTDSRGKDAEDGEDDGDSAFRDFSKPDNISFFILGAAVALLAVLLVVLGFILGKRRKEKQGKTDLTKDNNSEIE